MATISILEEIIPRLAILMPKIAFPIIIVQWISIAHLSFLIVDIVLLSTIMEKITKVAEAQEIPIHKVILQNRIKGIANIL